MTTKENKGIYKGFRIEESLWKTFIKAGGPDIKRFGLSYAELVRQAIKDYIAARAKKK